MHATHSFTRRAFLTSTSCLGPGKNSAQRLSDEQKGKRCPLFRVAPRRAATPTHADDTGIYLRLIPRTPGPA